VPQAVLAATRCDARELGALRDRVTAVRDAILESVGGD